MAANGDLLRRPPGVNWLADRPGNGTVASPTQNRLTAWLRGAQSLMPPHGAHPRKILSQFASRVFDSKEKRRGRQRHMTGANDRGLISLSTVPPVVHGRKKIAAVTWSRMKGIAGFNNASCRPDGRYWRHHTAA